MQAPAPSSPADPIISARLAQVEQELTVATGGASLCAISRSGARVDGVKYLEGRLAVLLEVRRKTEQGTASLPSGVALALERWQTELAAASARGSGADWIAYRSGGVDELDELHRLIADQTDACEP